jgi:hypothetical protein
MVLVTLAQMETSFSIFQAMLMPTEGVSAKGPSLLSQALSIRSILMSVHSVSMALISAEPQLR